MRGRGRRPAGVLLAAAIGLLTAPAAQASTPTPPPPGQVVVVAVPGLRWSDVSPGATPALDRLARTSAVGALSVKAGPDVSCVADGLLTLGAGSRATAYGVACGDGTGAAQQARRNQDSRERAVVGALGDAVRSAGGCATADGPLAALAVGQQAATATTGACALTIRAAPAVAGTSRPARTGTARAADAVVAVADRDRPAGSTLLVVGVSEAPGDRVAHLHVALATGPAFPRGALRSPSTGRAPYVQLVDVAPTVLRVLALPPLRGAVGQPWGSGGRAPGIAALEDLDTRAVAQKAATVPFFVVVVVAQIVLLALLTQRHRRRAAEVVALAGTAAPAACFLAGLLPWWRSGQPLAALLGLSAAAAALLVAAALPAARGAPRVGVVCALTVLVVALDLLTGAHLQVTGVAGYSPLVAGRFAGIGNVAFGVYAAAGLVATAWLARGRLAVVAVLGAALVAVDGAPRWGSDVGGVLALLPALVVLALLVTGRRVGLLRPALAAVAAVAVVTALAGVDATRPEPDRTHLGRFARQVGDGAAGDVLRRKAEAVLGLLLHSPVTAGLPLVAGAAAYLVLRPPPLLQRAFAAAPAYRHALLALGVACALGFVLNDSGAAVPALALVVVLPATVAVVSALPAGPPDR